MILYGFTHYITDKPNGILHILFYTKNYFNFIFHVCINFCIMFHLFALYNSLNWFLITFHFFGIIFYYYHQVLNTYTI